MAPTVVMAVALVIAWVAVAGALAFGLGRAVAVAHARERHAIPHKARSIRFGRDATTTTAGRSSIVRSR